MNDKDLQIVERFRELVSKKVKSKLVIDNESPI